MRGNFSFSRVRAIQRLKDKTMKDLPAMGRSVPFDIEPGASKTVRVRVNSSMPLHAFNFQLNYPIFFTPAIDDNGELVYSGTHVWEGKNFDIQVNLDSTFIYVSALCHDDDVEAPEWESVIEITATVSEDNIVIFDVEIIDN